MILESEMNSLDFSMESQLSLSMLTDYPIHSQSLRRLTKFRGQCQCARGLNWEGRVSITKHDICGFTHIITSEMCKWWIVPGTLYGRLQLVIKSRINLII